MAESLSEKLKSFGIYQGFQGLKPRAELQKQEFPISVAVDGFYTPTPFGEVFTVQRDYTADYLHGNLKLSDDFDFLSVQHWAKIDGDRLSRTSLVFLDTETSGLAGGTGTFIFLIGLGFFTDSGFRLVQLFLNDPSEEMAFIAAISRFVYSFSTVVTYNGKSFDLPIIQTRHIINRVPDPFESFNHMDILHLARKIWRHRLASRTLGDLEKEIIHLQRASEEIPGWMVPVIYQDYLKSQDARPLSGVFYHNANDILSLAAVFQYLSRLLSCPFEEPFANELDLVGAARLFEDQGDLQQAMKAYEYCLAKGLPKELYIITLNRYAGLYKNRKDWRAAEECWVKAIDFGDFFACIELAKYYEHHAKDLQKALHIAGLAEQILSKRDQALLSTKLEQKELAQRIQRIKLKQGASNHE